MTLGIDLSLRSTGICIMDNKGVLAHHEIIKTSKDNDLYREIAFIKNTIIELIIEFKVTAVTIESLSYGSMGQATRTLAMNYGAVVTAIYEKFNDILLLEVPPTTLKKFYAGSGKAKKQDMVDATPESIVELFGERYKKSTGLYDVIDAYALCKYSLFVWKNVEDG